MEFLLSSLLAFLLIILRDILPPQFYQSLNRFFLRLFPAAAASQSITTITIYEFDAFNNRELYDSARSYLVSKCFPSSPIVNFSKPKNSNTLIFTIESDQVMEDIFDGLRVTWSLRTTEKKYRIFGCAYRCRKIRSFELSFHNKHTNKVNSRYLPHVMQEAARIRRRNMNLRERNGTCGLIHVIGSLLILLMGSL